MIGTKSMTAYAFFDVDDTLIAVKSLFSFQDHWYATTGDTAGQGRFEDEMARLRRRTGSREILNRRYYRHFAGRSVAAVAASAKAWFAGLERDRPDLFHAPVVARLRRHQADGVEPVLVSGSCPALLAPVAARLGVATILAATLEQQDGRYTGRLRPPQTIGAGKAAAMAGFLGRVGGTPGCCYAYGDDLSDLPMLSAVGSPIVVAGSGPLASHARTVGWPVLAPR